MSKFSNFPNIHLSTLYIILTNISRWIEILRGKCLKYKDTRYMPKFHNGAIIKTILNCFLVIFLINFRKHHHSIIYKTEDRSSSTVKFELSMFRTKQSVPSLSIYTKWLLDKSNSRCLEQICWSLDSSRYRDLSTFINRKQLIEELHHFGLTSTYEEFLLFKGSPVCAARDSSSQKGCTSNDGNKNSFKVWQITLLFYLTWINFRVDKIFFWLFAKINPRKIFEKWLFAKINPPEIFKNSPAMLEIGMGWFKK